MLEHADGWVHLPNGKKVRPLNGWVFVYADEEDKFTESGIILKPQGAREHLFRKGTVLATSHRWAPKGNSDYVKLVPCPIPVDSRVVFLFFYAEHPSAMFRAWAGDNRLIPLTRWARSAD